ncbi:MAG: hypothetical protein CMK92_00440 [Pseudomonas sp.]|nr:hypothetical protein [Pseudomonas sp.]
MTQECNRTFAALIFFIGVVLAVCAYTATGPCNNTLLKVRSVEYDKTLSLISTRCSLPDDVAVCDDVECTVMNIDASCERNTTTSLYALDRFIIVNDYVRVECDDRNVCPIIKKEDKIFVCGDRQCQGDEVEVFCGRLALVMAAVVSMGIGIGSGVMYRVSRCRETARRRAVEQNNLREVSVVSVEVKPGDGEDGEEPKCAICLEPLTGSDVVHMKGVCEHQYHRACISEWAKRSPTCPTCRSGPTHD